MKSLQPLIPILVYDDHQASSRNVVMSDIGKVILFQTLLAILVASLSVRYFFINIQILGAHCTR